MKRAFDVLLSITALVLLLPAFIMIAMAIVLTSGRPAFFKQDRVGRNERRFVFWKFRTMIPKAGAERGMFEPGDLARITAIGRFLRKWKLDELPQLWNVLRGEMSIVGPRPEVPSWVAAYPGRWKEILSVRPGMTDPASLLFRNEESILAMSPDPEKTYREIILPQKMGIYESYVKTHTLWGDIRIMARTLLRIVGDKWLQQ